MGRTNRNRALLVSAAMILLCMTILIGMTWALFTDTQRVSNHLQAGDLTITLKRIGLTKTNLNSWGYLVEDTVQDADDPAVVFSNPTDENVFDLGLNEKVVPGSKYVANMQIENHSDVAFGYWIEIVCRDKTKGEDLAKQLKVTVNTGTDASDFVGNGLKVTGTNGSYVGVLERSAKGNFTVTVEFLDSAVADNKIEHNNLAQNETLDFDLVVHAVQVTTAPNP